MRKAAAAAAEAGYNVGNADDSGSGFDSARSSGRNRATTPVGPTGPFGPDDSFDSNLGETPTKTASRAGPRPGTGGGSGFPGMDTTRGGKAAGASSGERKSASDPGDASASAANGSNGPSMVQLLLGLAGDEALNEYHERVPAAMPESKSAMKRANVGVYSGRNGGQSGMPASRSPVA